MAEQKCDNCNNYECAWHVKFEPVPGWKAKPTRIMSCGVAIESYAIKDCPEFILNPRAKHIERTAPCCEECNSITKMLCLAKNGTCKDFQNWKQGKRKPCVAIKDSDVERLWHNGGTLKSMSQELNCDEQTIIAAKKRLGLSGNLKPKSVYRVVNSDGKEVSRGTAKHCTEIVGVSEPTFRKMLLDASVKNGLRAEVV